MKLTVGDEAVPLLLLQIDEDHPVKSQLDSGGWRIGDAVFAFTEGQVSVAAGTVHPLTVNLLLDFLQVAGFSVPAHEKSFFRSFRMDKLDGSPLLHIQTQPDLERLVTQKNATHVIVSFRNSGRNRVPDGVETFYYKFNPVEVEFILGSTFGSTFLGSTFDGSLTFCAFFFESNLRSSSFCFCISSILSISEVGICSFVVKLSFIRPFELRVL